jgi:PmbA protein
VGPSTSNFVLQPGPDSNEAIVKATKRGLYVTEMMGFGFNAVTGDFSRGASGFWIEDGQLAYPVSEVTISLNVDQLWQSIDAVGSDLDMRTSTASPTLRVASMTVAGQAGS